MTSKISEQALFTTPSAFSKSPNIGSINLPAATFGDLVVTGTFNGGDLAGNFVMTTGDAIIEGNKTFTNLNLNTLAVGPAITSQTGSVALFANTNADNQYRAQFDNYKLTGGVYEYNNSIRNNLTVNATAAVAQYVPLITVITAEAKENNVSPLLPVYNRSYLVQIDAIARFDDKSASYSFKFRADTVNTITILRATYNEWVDDPTPIGTLTSAVFNQAEIGPGVVIAASTIGVTITPIENSTWTIDANIIYSSQ